MYCLQEWGAFGVTYANGVGFASVYSGCEGSEEIMRERIDRVSHVARAWREREAANGLEKAAPSGLRAAIALADA